MDLTGIELGPKMQACSERERKFVWAYLLGLANGEKNATAAAREAGCKDPGGDSSAIRVRAFELMHRDRVRLAIKEVAMRHFEGLILPAVMAAGALIEKNDHPDHAGMVKSVLSSLGLGEAVRVKVEGEITVNHTDAAIDDLRRMKALGVPREKLIEAFGWSGLDRYEKMLAATDAKLIEGKAERVDG